MDKKKLMILLALLMTTIGTWAQVKVDEDQVNNDDEDEIVVTDQQGNEEVIEFEQNPYLEGLDHLEPLMSAAI